MDHQSVSNSRVRKPPDRFGDAVYDLSLQSEEKETFTDDSVADETYTPELNRTGFQNDSSSLDISLYFDKDFEKIDQMNQELDMNPNTNENLVAHDQPSATNPSEPCASETTSIFQQTVLEQLKILTENSIQIKVRIATIEESLIKNGTMISVAGGPINKTASTFEKFHSFMKAKNLPVKTVEAFKEFENNLNEESTVEAVSANI